MLTFNDASDGSIDVVSLDFKYWSVFETTRPMAILEMVEIIIAQITFTIVKFEIYKYLYPSREVNSQKSLNVFDIGKFLNLFIMNT